MIAKLKTLRQEMKRRRHRPVREQQEWLTAVLRGHYAYYGITGNSRSLGRFKEQVQRAWHWVLRHRGQRSRLPWDRFNRLLGVYPLPRPRIVHVWRYQTA